MSKVLLFVLVTVATVVLAPRIKMWWRTRTMDKEVARFALEYCARPALTPAETRMFRVLCDAVPEAVVAPQVALSALVDTRKDAAQPLPSPNGWVRLARKLRPAKLRATTHRRRAFISQKRLDFVLLDRLDGSVLGVVELDDHTHDSAKARKADRQRDALLEACGYPVVRFDARSMPSAATARSTLLGT